MSWGKGDPHKDPISIVFLDEAGRLREHTRIDNLSDTDNVDEFMDIIKRRQPNVVVIGGFSVGTYKLQQQVKELINPPREGADVWSAPQDHQGPNIPVIYVHDEVARIYQHSKRAAEEFSALTSITKYCIGLARYVQSPLNEFAALGSDITAINLHEYSDEEYQQLVSLIV
jgi:transcription elongation factor SPT6